MPASTTDKPLSIVYITPALYLRGGVERVLTMKANYLADSLGYDVTIILTEGKDKPYAYPLSDRVRVVNLDIGFEQLWTCSFVKKIVVYLRKQRRYRRLLTAELMRLRPDITDSLLRREINFITSIKDGSRKIGELHVNRANYRNFEAGETNALKALFARLWMRNLVGHLRRLDRFVVLTEEDRAAWSELHNVVAIPNPVAFSHAQQSPLTEHRVIAVGRYVYQKGFDMLLEAWQSVERRCPSWRLDIFGDGDRQPYELMIDRLQLDRRRCRLHPSTQDIQQEYAASSLCVFSSRFEGFGMVLLEAAACGLPMVSFACPCGPRDVITDGTDGLLVQNGDVAQLADKMVWLMQRPDEIVRMGHAAARKAKRYSMEQIGARWKQLFDDVMAR